MKKTTLAVVMSLALVSVSATASNTWQDKAKDAWIDGKAETVLLLNGNLNSFNINTDVENGKVILTGKVNSEVEKALAEELIEGLEGVTGVDNKLTVIKGNPSDKDEKSGSTLKDAKIATVVKTRLLFESQVSGTSISVDVDNSVVTLSGNVSSNAEKDLAITMAKNTKDVSRVIDKLKVTP